MERPTPSPSLGLALATKSPGLMDAFIANVEDHHPGYNHCRVRYSTHAVKGLSHNDFICAAKIDRLPLI